MTTAAEVEALYQDAVQKLQALSDSNAVPFEQRKAARAALKEMVLTHAQHVVEEIAGRTALLTALIAELDGVISKIKVNPIGDALDTLNGMIGRAREIQKELKTLTG